MENEDYAFLMESTSIDYVTERNCKVYKVRERSAWETQLWTPSLYKNLQELIPQVGEALDSKGYGIAMKKGKSALASEALWQEREGSI